MSITLWKFAIGALPLSLSTSNSTRSNLTQESSLKMNAKKELPVIEHFEGYKEMGFDSEAEAIEWGNKLINTPPMKRSAVSERRMERVFRADGSYGLSVVESVRSESPTLVLDLGHPQDMEWDFPIVSTLESDESQISRFEWTQRFGNPPIL